jgi:hypothetical protein
MLVGDENVGWLTRVNGLFPSATSTVWSRSQGRQDQQEEQEGEEEQAEEGQSRNFTSDRILVVSTVSANLATDDLQPQVRGTAKRKAGEPAKKK